MKSEEPKDASDHVNFTDKTRVNLGVFFYSHISFYFIIFSLLLLLFLGPAYQGTLSLA